MFQEFSAGSSWFTCPVVGLGIAASFFFIFGGIGLIKFLIELLVAIFGGVGGEGAEVDSALVIVEVVEFIHVFLVSALLVYFPFSKLLHAPGVFLSPTRNLANNNRAKRHINPWNPPIIGHTYAEWEEEFHDKLVASGYVLDKE